MQGLIALVGAGEYLPVMDEIDRHLLASVSAPGREPSVVCLPTAAGEEGEESVGRWLKMGEQHFAALGAKVQALPIIDRASAQDPQYESILEGADLIYFSGGNPMYLHETMRGSAAWEAANRAWSRGAVCAGCSAGAMILAKRMPNFRRMGASSASDGFGIIPAEYVMPHFDHTGPFRYMVSLLQHALKDGQFMLGIDENTALVGKARGEWKVMGSSKVHVLTRTTSKSFGSGDVVPMP
jgi:cyanophycinase